MSSTTYFLRDVGVRFVVFNFILNRFKQLKEEEARRKRQMEEEKMKSEVAAANKNAVQLVESGTDQHATASVDASTDGTATNGRIDGCSKEHQDATEVTSENGRPINGTADGTAGEDSEDINQVLHFICLDLGIRHSQQLSFAINSQK